MAQRNYRRVLIITADGMRPDLLDPAITPTYARLAGQGVRFADYHASYPPHTRVQVSTLATGVAPGRHGIVANVMRVPGANGDGIVDTSNWDHIQGLDALSGGHAVMAPTLSELLEARDERLAVAATSSAGAAILWTRTAPYRLVNTNTTYGRADLYTLREKLGELPPAGLEHRFERLAYATRAVTDIFLDDAECRVIVFWMSEPDSSLHYFGLGSPEAIDALRACDQAVASIMEALRAKGLEDQFDVLLLSDHGHSTVRHHRSLTEYVERAGAELSGDVTGRLTFASDYVYDATGSNRAISAAELAPLVRWLQEQPWTGALLGGTPEVARLPGVLPLEAAWMGQSNGRAPLLAVTPVWTHEVNEHGVPGTVAALTQQVALKSTHGAASPYDLHALAVAVGPDFQAGVVSAVPAGATDIVPTVLALLGMDHPASMDGRILWEALDQPQGQVQDARDIELEPSTAHPDRFAPVMRLHSVGPVSYLDRVLNG